MKRLENDTLTLFGGNLPAEIGHSITSVSLHLSETISVTEWQQVGYILQRLSEAHQWWLGDWWNAGVKWGEGEEVCRTLGLDYGSVRNVASVTARFQLSRRRDNLPFSHHIEVCALDDVAVQDRLLSWCEEPLATTGKPRSVRELRDEIRAQSQLPERLARLRRAVSLDEWSTLSLEEQHQLLHLDPSLATTAQFNPQETTAIEWAQFSWNPVSGCLHNCPYCYARDIALMERMSKVYPYGFAPTLHPLRLLAPRHMKLPAEAATDTRYRNVFTCSMADLFGRWVPTDWIEAVLREIRQASQWNFLCLTKFPKRAVEFSLPPNLWMGTTVDLQARVKAAEDAFAQVTAGVRWLSVEPMLEPLRFQHLERFDWIVIGGASRSSQTPEWHPPFPWIADLLRQARAAGCKVYFKTNLLKKRLLEMPFDAPIEDDNAPAPEVFAYLK